MKKFVKSAALFRTLLAVGAVLLPISIGGQVVTSDWSGYINKYLHITNTEIVSKNNKGEDPIHFHSDYNNYQDVMNHAREVAKQVEAEGAVLMRNENQALPLAKNSKVTVFGYNSVDVALGGSGSGGVSSSAERKVDLKEALSEKFDVNPTVYDFYQAKYDAKEGFIESKGWGGKTLNFRTINSVNEIDASKFTEEVTKSFDNYKDAAFFVLTRIGGEGTDLKADYLELTEEEKSVLETMKNGPFKKRIVLVNTFNTPELGWLKDYNIDACLYIGGPGEVGLASVSGILAGEISPSGRLSDTYVYDVESAPAAMNFGNFEFQNAADIANPDSRKYLMYDEGIYVGYRYYETRYEDYVLGRFNASSTTGAKHSTSGWKYDEEVLFPFGYGLSYATFTQDLNDVRVDWDKKTARANVTVKNTSSVYSGKDVIELFAQAPYTEGGVEKSAVQLAAFTKTDELKPGEQKIYQLDIDLRDIASYDAKTNKTFVLDAGDYYFALGKGAENKTGAHEALNNILAAKGLSDTQRGRMDAAGEKEKAWKVTKSSFDGDEYRLSKNNATITNQFDNVDFNTYAAGTDQATTYLSRSSWDKTYPKTRQGIVATDKMKEEINSYYSPKNDGTTSPSAYEKGEEDTSSITTDAEKRYTLAMMIGVDYDDPSWDSLLDQLTLDDYYNSTKQGREKMDSVGLNATTAVDGPAAWTKSTYIKDYRNQYDASKVEKTQETMVSYPTETVISGTWNLPLTQEVGKSFGEEGLWGGGVGWYGPGANTHRTAMGGRNFEYFSEDGFLGGKLAEAEIHGAMEKGTIPYLKHFFLNDQETNRIGVYTFANEQAIREVYLRQYQYAFEKTGKDDPSCSGVMGGFNRLGLVWTGHDANLWKNVMAKEWGFRGNITTDFGQKQGSLMEPQLAYEAGTTMFCSSGKGFATYLQGLHDGKGIRGDAKLMKEMREAIHTQLYNFANSAAMNGLTSDSEIVTVRTWYQNALLACVIVSSCLIGVSAVMLGISTFAARKEN